MNVENYDSPFYSVVESPTDRLIQEVKKRYCGFLRDLLEKIKDIEIMEMIYPKMSCHISVLFLSLITKRPLSNSFKSIKHLQKRLQLLLYIT
jgi:hypothetical protein